MGRVPGVAVRPGAGRLLEAQARALQVGVRVRHGVAAPRAVFAAHQITRVISKLRRPCGVNHVCEPIHRVVLQRDVRAVRIIDEGQIAEVVKRVKRVASGFAPAVGQAAVGPKGETKFYKSRD